MKILHTGDWHIGKSVNNMNMEEDQRYILEEICQIIQEESIDLLVIAGDIYDRSVPSASAVALLDEFLTKIKGLGTKICMISGNHDSPQRVEFASKILEKESLFVEGTHGEKVREIRLEDGYGPVHVFLLPFIRPSMFRGEGEAALSYDETFHQRLDLIALNENERNILVAHQFVVGAQTCESEELSVGGLDMVSAKGLDRFDYVALGHIHSPQIIQKETIRYSGTPLAYSFSEEKNENSVSIIHLKEKGDTEIYLRKLHPLRKFQTLKGKYKDLIEASFYKDLNRDNYFRIILEDEYHILEVLDKLRVIYPNIMTLHYENLRTSQNQDIQVDQSIQEKAPVDIFEQFYFLQNNQNLEEDQKKYLQKIIEEVWEDIE